MVGFSRKFNVSYDALVMFVDEKFNYRDRHHCLSSSIILKIDAFVKVIKAHKEENEIYSFDISEKTKCFIIKNKTEELNNYLEDLHSDLETLKTTQNTQKELRYLSEHLS